MSDLATINADLAKLRAARTALVSGQMRQSVEYEGRRVIFMATDLKSLNAEIARLEALAAAASGKRVGGIRYAYQSGKGL